MRWRPEWLGRKKSHLGQFNVLDCKASKQFLSAVARNLGRVRLSTFYNRGLRSQLQFTEDVSYLRDLGALDESILGQPLLIPPNHVDSRPQCWNVAHFEAICCRDEWGGFVNG